MPRSFNAAELDEMQVDWQRTHNVKIVAELHGCTQPEVVQALGLDPAKYAKSGGRTWEKKHPDEAAAFCALVDGGMSILGPPPLNFSSANRQAGMLTNE